MKRYIFKSVLTAVFCLIFTMQASAAYKLPDHPYPEEKVPDANYIYYPNIAEANSAKSAISLKDAYEKNLPYAENTIVATRNGMFAREDFDNYEQAKALYGITEEEYNYLWPDMPGYKYTFRYMEQLSGFDYDSFFKIHVPFTREKLRNSSDSKLEDADKIYFEDFVKEKFKESRDNEVLHLGMPIDSKYPEMVLDNFVYHNGKLMFSVITYGEYNAQSRNWPRFDIYNKKTGTTAGVRWSNGRYGNLLSDSESMSIHQYFIYPYSPEDLEDLVLCYDRAYMESIFKR